MAELKKVPGFYEVIPHIKDECDEVTLAASFTPNNGIRIGILDPDQSPDWAEFDFTVDQAEMIGQALVRWAQRSRAEREMIRCTYPNAPVGRK